MHNGQPEKKIFVLGGETSQIRLIKMLLSMAGEKFVQPKIDQGDYAYSPSDLGLRLEEHGVPGTTTRGTYLIGYSSVIFVECKAKEGTWSGKNKHYGVLQINPEENEDTGHASVLQVMPLLTHPFSSETRRWCELVAVNLTDGSEGMVTLGASDEEVARVEVFVLQNTRAAK